MSDGTGPPPAERGANAWQRGLVAVVPMVVAAVAVALFALRLTSGPVAPSGAWEVVPVANFDVPEPSLVEALDPGLRLGGYDQISARGAGAPRDLTLSFAADLGDDGSLHAIVRGKMLRRRDLGAGASLFLTRAEGVDSGLYLLGPDGVEPLRCDAGSAAPVPRRVRARVEVRGAAIQAFVDDHLLQSCALPSGLGAAVGFRAGLSDVSVSAIELRGPAGQLRFQDTPEWWAGPWVKGAAVVGAWVLLALVWLVDGAVTRWMLGRGRWVDPLRPTLAYLAWGLLALAYWMDVDALAAGLRLGRTPLVALQVGLATAAFTSFKAIGFLASAPRFRLGDGVPEPPGAMLGAPGGRVFLGLAGAHALVLGGLAAVSGGGVLAMVGADLPWVDAPVTAVVGAAAAVAWLAAARLVARSGGSGPIVAVGVGVLAWSTALALGALVGGGVWGARLHLALLALVAAAVGLVVAQVNAERIRAYNWVSLASALAILGLAECTARQTYLDQGWDPVPIRKYQAHPLLGWVRASNEFDFILDVREHSDYPSERFPVAFEADKSGKTRIVALGSSSTGGAFQMDDLDEFYPAQLQRRLEGVAPGRFEVLNQGVGGWNSFLVRLYLGTAIDELDPDIVTVYLGGNDVNTLGGWTYADYWRTYQQGGGRAPWLRGVLNSSRLYVGFKSALLLLNTRGAVPAVPLDDARDNYTRIIELAQEHGARVVLMSEAYRPTPARLQPYYDMMRELAADKGELFLDVAGLLHQRSQDDLFLDANHLTVQGHEAIADLLLTFLQDNGLVER